MQLTTRATALADAPDATLAERAADGDERAFEVLVRRHAGLLRAIARRTLGSTDELDDVVQDTFITAWRRLDELDDSAKVKPWLVRILSHRCIDRIRARRAHVDVDDVELVSPAEGGPERVAEAHSREQAVWRALDALPEAQRRCWVLKEVSGYRYEEIAEELHLPASTVRGLLSRARQNMIRMMEEWR